MKRVVYVAATRKLGESLQESLSLQGILSCLRPLSAEGEGPCELSVAAVESEEALEIINETFCRRGG